ncbi:AraC family transcriptional regulator [Erwinia persicina]|uniref:AraC family transcriptional regulator n=1 Tax=Erwinia persicina TaxID=55211 RepID=UPI00210DB0C4|nr:AraC family transcriptional regulator [Erwinia persicina]MCQ4095354.1 AraC family transcriptional regulator [Erwinia persicina]MCQ4098849.1 AraC family transcriptional regulator [Erwinia persicina]
MQKDIHPHDIAQFGLNIYQYGHEVCASQHSYGPAVRQHYLIHYVISGGGTLFAGDRRWPVRQGEAFLIHPHEITTYKADKQRPWEYMWLELDGLIAIRSLEKCGLRRDMPIWRPKDTLSANDAAQCLQQLVAQDPVHSLRIAGLTCLFLDALIANVHHEQKEEAGSGNKHLDNAVQFMERHYHRSVSIGEVAEYCNIDRSYLSRLFQQQFGYGPKQYLLLLRMDVATSLLSDHSLPVKIIAYSLGYTSQMQFAKVFQQHFHCSPTQWRREKARMT